MPGFAASPVVVPLFEPTAPHAPASAPAATAGQVALPRLFTMSAADIPHRVVAAYANAVVLADRSFPACHLVWQTLAGIGYIESGDARSGGSTRPGWDGVASPPILGLELDGRDNVTAVLDTDGGALDGDSRWDRAVGPMQLLPSTWSIYRADGNADGAADPQQIDDAAFAAADYLCAGAADLAKSQGLRNALFTYDHSWAYVRAVLRVAARYAGVSLADLGVKHRAHRAHHADPVMASPKPSSSPTSTSSPRSSAPAHTPPPSPPPSPSPTPTSTPSPSSGPPSPGNPGVASV